MADKQTTTDPTPSTGAATAAQPGDEVNTDAAVTSTSADEPSTTSSTESVATGESTTVTNEESTDEDVTEWARKKGLPLSAEPTENELKMARSVQAAEKRMHDSTQRTSELETAVGEQIDDAAANNPDLSASDARLAKIEAGLAVEKFFRSTPEASNYETKMAELVRENPARARLPLTDLYELAVARSGQREDAKREGGREALESLARKQKATAPRGNAVSSIASGNKITRQAINEAMQRGDDAWLADNSDEINRLTAEGSL